MSARAKLRYERALVIQQLTLGRNHPMVAVLFDRYAGLLRDLGQPVEAKMFAVRAADIRARQIHSSRLPVQSRPNERSREAQYE